MRTTARAFILSTILFIWCNVLFAQKRVVQWVHMLNESGSYYGGPPASVSNSIQTILGTPDGIMSLTSGKGSGLSSSQAGVAISKFDLDGKQQWKFALHKCYSDDKANGRIICTTPKLPNYDFIVSQSNGALVFGTRLLFIDNTGQMQWELPLQKTKSAIQLTDGNYIVADSSSKLYKIDKSGNQLWEKAFTGISDIRQTSDNGFVVTGPSGTKKMNGQGDIQWSNPLYADNIRQTTDGAYIAWGTNSIVKLSSAGQQSWIVNQNGIGSLVVTKDNGCIITSTQLIKKISTGGGTEWSQVRSENLTAYPADDDNIVVTRSKISPGNASSELIVERLNIKSGLGWNKRLSIPTLLNVGLLALPDGGIAVRLATLNSPSTLAYLFKLSNESNECKYLSTITTSSTCESTSGYLLGAIGQSLVSGSTYNISTSLASFQWKKEGNPISGANAPDYFANEPGLYSLVITQDGCSVESSPVRIGGISAPTITTDKNSICEGQSVTLTATNCPGSIKWSSGETALSIVIQPKSTTTYTATCEKDVCKSSNSNAISIEVSPKILATLTTSNRVICTGKESTLTANTEGGTQPFSYQFVNDGQNFGGNIKSITISNGGNYSVIVTDAKGCNSTSQSISVTKVDLNIGLTSDKTEFCKGGNATLTTTITGGNAPFNYQWKNGNANVGQNTSAFNITVGGGYSVVLTDANGCTANSNTVLITEKGADIVSSITAVGATEVFAPQTVKLNAATGLGYGYQWQKEEQNINGANLPNYEATTSGKYRVIVTRDECAVPSASINVLIQTPTSISPDSLKNDGLTVFPNPFNHYVRMQYQSSEKSKAEFRLIDVQGKTVKTWIFTEERKAHFIEEPLEQINKGAYVLQVITPHQRSSIQLTKD